MSGPAIDPLHHSAVAEQLQHGFPWLRFEDVLEGEYQRDHFQQGLVQLRLNLVLGIGLVLAFVAMDRMVLPTASTLLTVLRYGVVLPSLAVCLGVTFIPHGWRVYRWTIAVIGPLLALAIVALGIWIILTPFHRKKKKGGHS